MGLAVESNKSALQGKQAGGLDRAKPEVGTKGSWTSCVGFPCWFPFVFFFYLGMILSDRHWSFRLIHTDCRMAK